MTNSSEKACPQCEKGVKPALLKCPECGFRFPLNKPAATTVAATAQVTIATAPAQRVTTSTTSSGPRLVNGKTIMPSGPRVIGASRPTAAQASTSAMPRTVSIAAPVEAPRSVGCESVATVKQQPATSAAVAPNTQQPTNETSNAGNADVLLVTCECGASFRVKAEWSGRRRKCTKCSKPVLVPVVDDFDADEMADRLALEADIKAAIRQLEAAPQEVALKKAVSAATLSKLEKRLAVNSVFSEEEAHQRRAAILELGKTHDIRAFEFIQRLKADDFAVVRVAVAQAIAELPDPRGVPVLLQLLSDKEENVVNEALRALRVFPNPVLVRPLLRVGLTSPIQKLHAAEVLAQMGTVITPALLDVVQRRDRGMLLDAVVLLGRMQDANAVPALLDALNHTSGPLRAYTLEALGRIGDKRAVGAMVALLDDPDEVIQMNAIMALERVPDARTVKPLLGKLTSDCPELRRRAVIALGRMGDARAVAPIINLLPTAEGREREAILETLCSIGDESAASVLFPLLTEPIAEQQRQILNWARRVTPPGFVEQLLPVLPLAPTAVRRAAADVLGEYPHPNAVQALRELAKDLAPDVRAASLKALAKTAKSQALPTLEQALREEATVRIAAVIAIGTVNDPRSLPALMAMLKDGLPEVRYHAVKTIGKLGAKQAEAALRPLLEDPEQMVQTAAEKAFEDLGLTVPKRSLSKAWSKKLSGMLPDFVAGAMPGRTLAMGAAVLLAITGGLFMVVMGARLTTNSAMAAASADEVASIAATSDTQLALWTKQGSVRLLNVTDNKVEKDLAVGKSGRFAVSGASSTVFAVVDQKLTVWDLESSPQPPASAEGLTIGNEPPQVSKNGKVALSTMPSQVVVWSLAQHKQLARFPVSTAVRPALSHDGQQVLAVTRDGVRLALFSAETGEELVTLLTEALKVREIALSPDGKKAFVVDDSHGAVIDIETQAVKKLEGKTQIPNPQFLNNDTIIGSRGLTVFRLTLSDGKVATWQLEGVDEQVSQLLPVDGGKKLAAFGTDDNDHGRAWVLDLASGQSSELKL